MTPHLTGVVVCGGASTRFEGDKIVSTWRGLPLYEVVATRLEGIAAPVILARGPRELPSSRLQVDDAVSGAGPIGGVLAGLRAADTDLVAVVAGDMPFINVSLLRLLAASIGPNDVAAVPVTERGLEPLHAIYRASCAAVLEREIDRDRRSLQGVLANAPVRLVPPTIWRHLDRRARFAVNLNSPEDAGAASGR